MYLFFFMLTSLCLLRSSCESFSWHGNVHMTFYHWLSCLLLLRVKMVWLGSLVRVGRRESLERGVEKAHRGRRVSLVIMEFLGCLVLRERRGRKVLGGLRVLQGEMGLMGQRGSKERLAQLGVRVNLEQR